MGGVGGGRILHSSLATHRGEQPGCGLGDVRSCKHTAATARRCCAWPSTGAHFSQVCSAPSLTLQTPSSGRGHCSAVPWKGGGGGGMCCVGVRLCPESVTLLLLLFLCAPCGLTRSSWGSIAGHLCMRACVCRGGVGAGTHGTVGEL